MDISDELRSLLKKLLDQDRPEIFLKGEVDGAMYEYVQAALLFLKTKGSPDVLITIDSGGGGVGPGLDIYDLFRMYPGKKTACVTNRAASMAAVILQACEVRTCARHSSVMIHHVSRSSMSLATLEDPAKLEKAISKMRRHQDRLEAILSARTQKSVREIAKKCKQTDEEDGEYMTAEEALAFGLIDSIV